MFTRSDKTSERVQIILQRLRIACFAGYLIECFEPICTSSVALEYVLPIL